MRTRVVLMACIVAAGALAAQPGRRRALLIGINDYTASSIRTRVRPAAPGRDWPNLTGGVNDVQILQEMLVLLYGFEPRDIVTLTDQNATRAAILQALEQHLVAPAAKDDVLFFYYAGHGSQVRNSKSDEPDQLDESLIPADSRLGAPDIRDKELRQFFNRMLDRGAHLTVMLDNCYSGSGARGLPTGAIARAVKADLRDVADATRYGPRPESRGALVLSATQDFARAWETKDEGQMHGVFSWAWIGALRDASAGEAASDTFLRADARMRAETPFQEPVMAGMPSTIYAPFLGVRTDRNGDRTVIAVEKVQSDGTVLLQGGWAHGLSIGTQLRVLDERTPAARLVITSMLGLGRSEARMEANRAMPQAIRSGALLEVAGWAAPPGRPMRVWAPRIASDPAAIHALARRLANECAKRGVRWISDPTDSSASHLLRWSHGTWEMLGPDGTETLGANASEAIAATHKLRGGAALFVQFPAPVAMIDELAIDARKGIVPVARAEEADYILTGRYSTGGLAYAWVRPAIRASDRRKSGLPVRTAWMAAKEYAALRESMLRLRRIHAWHHLESPAEARSPYRFALRRVKNGVLVDDGALIGNERYEIVLRTARPAPQRIQPRYFYAFVIDSHGTSTLLLPQHGSVENRFPDAALAEIALGAPGTFEIAPPYGIDTYFLLTTDEPLPNPWILAWDGVRSPTAATPLEQLLMLTDAGTRSGVLATPATWSIERVVFESVQPRRH